MSKLKIDGVQKLGGSSAGRNICQGAELGCAELRRRVEASLPYYLFTLFVSICIGIFL